MSTLTKNVKGYARVSTDLQLDGVSLEVQEARIVDYCAQHGYNLIKMYKDVLSGKSTNRPQLQLMLDELRAGEIVIVVDLSRLSRTVRDALNLIDQFTKMKVGFIAITQPFDTTSPMGEAMMTIQMVFNQLERQNTALKVKGAMQSLKQQGKLRGRPPFGWKFAGKDKDFEPDFEQQEVLEKIKQLHADGASMNKIAIILNQAGDNKCLANNKKNPDKFKDACFYQSTIKRILVENGLMEGGNMTRKPIELQIVSHHKSTYKSLDTQTSVTPELPTLTALPDDPNVAELPQYLNLPPPPPPVLPPSYPRNLPPPPVLPPSYPRNLPPPPPVLPSSYPYNLPPPPIRPAPSHFHNLPPPPNPKLL